MTNRLGQDSRRYRGARALVMISAALTARPTQASALNGASGRMANTRAVTTAQPNRKKTAVRVVILVACHRVWSGNMRQRRMAPVIMPRPRVWLTAMAVAPARRASEGLAPVPR